MKVLALLLALPLAAQTALDLGNPVDRRLTELQKAGDPSALADFFEGLDPKDRQRHLEAWIQALNKARRWERLLQACGLALQAEGSVPRMSPARMARAQALARLERNREALGAYLELGRLGWATGLENACALARAEGDWGSLAQAAEELAKARPGLGGSLRGEALCKQLRFGEAEPVLEEALKHPGHTAMAWADLACCRVERGAYREAVEAADRALALEAGLLEALYNRGRARFGLKDYAQGREDLAAALATGKADSALETNLRQYILAADRFLAYQERKRRK